MSANLRKQFTTRSFLIDEFRLEIPPFQMMNPLAIIPCLKQLFTSAFFVIALSFFLSTGVVAQRLGHGVMAPGQMAVLLSDPVRTLVTPIQLKPCLQACLRAATQAALFYPERSDLAQRKSASFNPLTRSPHKASPLSLSKHWASTAPISKTW